MEPYRDLGTYEGLSGFQGAVGKVVRVKYQLRELELRFKTVTESHPYRLSEKFELRPDKKLGDYSFVIESVSVPKREWGILIGELVHNLRSALDHAVYAAAKRPGDKTQFPIFTQRADWDKKAGPMIRSVPDTSPRSSQQFSRTRLRKATTPAATSWRSSTGSPTTTSTAFSTPR